MYKHSPHCNEDERSPKRLKESNAVEKRTQPLSPPLMQSVVAAAVAAAANVGHQYPVRPMNVHSTKINSNCSRLINAPALCSNPIPRNTNTIPSDIAVSFFVCNIYFSWYYLTVENLHFNNVYKIYN